MDIGRAHGGHLPALHVADAAIGMEHEDVHPLAPGHGIDRRAAGIATGGADDGQVIVAPGEEMLEQLAEQLQRHVLEGERGAVEQLQQPLLLVELLERRHRDMAETAIGARAQFAQLVLAQARGDERQHHPHRQLDIGEARHAGDLGLAETRPFARQIEPAIAGEPSQGDPFEIERLGASACGDIFHGQRA